MLKPKIPLDRIYRVFFCDDQYSGSDIEDSDSSLSEEVPVPETMNDYTVIKLGEKPVPTKSLLPKYPKFDRKVIPNNIPSMFYSVKIQLPPEPEYVPPPRPKPRKCNPENFKRNAYKRELCGKTPFEQDLLIIKHRQDVLDEFYPQKPEPKKNFKPPKMYYREEEERRKAKEEMEKQQDKEIFEAMRKEERRRRRFEREAEKLRKEKEERQSYLQGEIESAKEEQRAWLEEEKQINREKWKNFVPDRPTRASQLRDETCRRKMEREFLDDRREKLNAEMRKEIEKEQMKRLSMTLLRLKPSDETKNSANKMRKEMQRNTRNWNRWLKLVEQDIGRQTMLERIYDENENMMLAKEDKTELKADTKKPAS